MNKLYSTKSNRLPSKGEPGDVYFATDLKETFICIGDGRLFSLPVLLSGAHVVPAVGPRGEQGLPGSAVHKGDKGDRGEVGPAGKGEKGDRGEKGERGEITMVGPEELQAAVIELRKKLAKAHAAILQGMADGAGLPQHLRVHVRQQLELVKKNAGL